MDKRAVIIGNFDGVHLGHQYVIGRLRDEAVCRGLKTMAITFDKHPKEIFDASFVPAYITTVEEKVEMLMATGLDDVCVIPFTREFADITARDFLRWLYDEKGVRLLLLGYDNRFGRYNADEAFPQYQQYGKEIGIEVLQSDSFVVAAEEGRDVPPPSSSLIRHLIMSGDMEGAAMLLGRPYSLSGIVEKGYQEGRKIGFPTANITHPVGKLLPPNGVYATSVFLPSTTAPMPSITNVGTRPTYGSHKVTIETHIPDFIGDLYGAALRIDFTRKIRNERQFSSPEELRKQIEKDIHEVR
ncbi:MAG: riboflavin biosynthesis protein RibF [Prevotella sp.]|nr:riboflavin biosynthesis protein RibF [Candidatus Prevotella equi]